MHHHQIQLHSWSDKNNHLTYEISVGSMIGKYIIMILLTIIAVRGTSKSVSRLSPAQALR